MDRYTRKDAEAAFGRLAQAFGKDTGSAWIRLGDGHYAAKVGAWVLDCNPTYGGYVIGEMVNEGGGESRPFGDRRMPAREFVQTINFALRVLEAAKVAS